MTIFSKKQRNECQNSCASPLNSGGKTMSGNRKRAFALAEVIVILVIVGIAVAIVAAMQNYSLKKRSVVDRMGQTILIEPQATITMPSLTDSSGSPTEYLVGSLSIEQNETLQVHLVGPDGLSRVISMDELRKIAKNNNVNILPPASKQN